MEASDAFGTPTAPAPAGEETTTPAEPAAQEPVTPEPTATPAEPQGAQAPDLGEQMAALMQEVQGLRATVSPEQEPSAENLYEQLAGIGEPEGEYGAQEPASAEFAAQESDPFDEIIRERVAEVVSPLIGALESDRRRSQLDSLAERHPEILERDMQEAITDRLGEVAERYGNEMILTDPALVEAVLIAEKAARASAAEVPAEEAATQGAALETAAGAAAQEQPLTPEETIKQGILAAGGGQDLFT